MLYYLKRLLVLFFKIELKIIFLNKKRWEIDIGKVGFIQMVGFVSKGLVPIF